VLWLGVNVAFSMEWQNECHLSDKKYYIVMVSEDNSSLLADLQLWSVGLV